MQHKILITGATGNLGSKVAAELLTQNANLRVTGRAAEKLTPFAQKTECLAGNLEEESFLQKALENMDAVFLVLPQLEQKSVEQFAESFIRVAEQQGVRYVVNISNCTLKRFSRWTALLELEQHLNNATRLHIKHLRCANFFENLLWGIDTPYHPDIKLPYISSYEIAHVAARYLVQKDFENISVEELLGREDYSMQDFARMLGVTYRQVPAPKEHAAFFEAFNSGQYELVPRTAHNTSTRTEPRFSLDYFLQQHFSKPLIE